MQLPPNIRSYKIVKYTDLDRNQQWDLELLEPLHIAHMHGAPVTGYGVTAAYLGVQQVTEEI